MTNGFRLFHNRHWKKILINFFNSIHYKTRLSSDIFLSVLFIKQERDSIFCQNTKENFVKAQKNEKYAGLRL